MLTTKAYIIATPEEGDNVFKVNIPLMADNVNDEAIFDALLCSSSGNYNDYKVGDCVFVDFEDDKYNTAIIMGKLYTEVPNENEVYGLYNELKVTGSAILPEDTRIGPYTTQDIFNLYQAAQNFKFEDRDYVEFYMLKQYLAKSEFNKFFGDEYFNDDYPYDESSLATFDNTLETGTEESNKVYNTNYAPDYKTLRTHFKNFLQTTLSKLYGLTNNASIAQIIAKMSVSGSQTYTSGNVNRANPIAAVNDSYFPNYTKLVDHLKKFFKTDLPGLVSKIYTEVDSRTSKKFIKFEDTDYSPKADEVYARVVTAQGWINDGKKSNVIYFLTDVPR